MFGSVRDISISISPDVSVHMSYHVAVCGLVVLRGAEAGESLLEHEDAERVT